MNLKKELFHILMAFVFMLGCLSTITAQPDFKRVIIDANGPKDPFGKTIGDLDGDGFIDFIEGGQLSGGLVWYKNPGNPFAAWKKYQILEGRNFSTDHETADIDRDGKLDLVFLCNNYIGWLKNDGSPEDGGWIKTQIDATELHDIEVADFDGDGDVDIIGRDQSEWVNKGNVLHFFEQINPEKWVHTTRECPHGEGLLAVDIDGDNRKDIVVGSKWYKNPGKMHGPDWTEQVVSSRWEQGNVFVAAGDVSGDGLVDLVLVPSERVYNNYHISWFEHPKKLKDSWKEHVLVDSVQSDYHFVGCADFNLDGKTDIVMAETHLGDDPDEVSIYLNQGKGASWNKKVLWDGGSHSCRVFDCDQDGDMDLIGSNFRGTEVNLWVNQAIKPKPLPLDK